MQKFFVGRTIKYAISGWLGIVDDELVLGGGGLGGDSFWLTEKGGGALAY